LRTNWNLKAGEIDILAIDKQRILRIIEVRGKTSSRLRPSQTLSFAKKTRLKTLAHLVQSRYRRKVRIELLEIIGQLPQVKIRSFRIDATD